MKKLLIVIGFIAVSITCVNAQLFMHLGSSDSSDVLGLIVGPKGFNDSLKPDLYIDDVKYDSKILDMIDPGKIGSINVMKGEAAIKEYNAPNGAIFITSKAATGKSGNPNEIRLRATGNFNSSDPAFVIDGLSDEEFNKMTVDAKDRAIGVERLGNMVIVIDGKVAAHDELSKISALDIESIKVLKGDEAMEKYNAPNATIIETKKKKE